MIEMRVRISWTRLVTEEDLKTLRRCLKIRDLLVDKDQVVFSTDGDKPFRAWASETMHGLSLGKGPLSLSVANQTYFEHPWVQAANLSDHLCSFASNGKDTWYYDHQYRKQYIESSKKDALVKDSYFPEGLEWKSIELGTMRQFHLISSYKGV